MRRNFSPLFVISISVLLSGCPDTNQVSATGADGQPAGTTSAPKTGTTSGATSSSQTSSTGEKGPKGDTGPQGPQGLPGTPAPLAYGADSSAAANSLYINASGQLGIGTQTPSTTMQITAGETHYSSGCGAWSSDCFTTTNPLLVLGAGAHVKRTSGIQSMLHINTWTPYRGDDDGGAITMGPSWRMASSESAMKTRIATSTDVGNSLRSRLKFQTTKSAGGWNEGISLWEDGSASIGIGWAGLTEGPGASLTVKGVSSLPLLNLAAESDGSSKVLVDASGNMGIGVTPARKLHIGDAMRLQPITSPPASASNGDLYFDDSDALCVKVTAGWTKLAGAGTCS